MLLVLFKDRTQAESRVSSLGGLWNKRCCGHNRVCYGKTKLRWEIQMLGIEKCAEKKRGYHSRVWFKHKTNYFVI